MRLKLNTICSVYLVVVLCSCNLFAQCTADSVDCLHMTLVPRSSAYKLGKPIIVNMVFTNMSDHEVPIDYIHAGDQGYACHFEVTQVITGKRLNRTDEGKELAYENLGGQNPHPDKVVPELIVGGGQVPLAPNTTKTFPTILSRIFDFRDPGTYRVEVLRDQSKFQVAPITIVVVP